MVVGLMKDSIGMCKATISGVGGKVLRCELSDAHNERGTDHIAYGEVTIGEPDLDYRYKVNWWKLSAEDVTY
jgi:hypothetical protein